MRPATPSPPATRPTHPLKERPPKDFIATAHRPPTHRSVGISRTAAPSLGCVVKTPTPSFHRREYFTPDAPAGRADAMTAVSFAGENRRM
jgi:hypothetical protein